MSEGGLCVGLLRLISRVYSSVLGSQWELSVDVFANVETLHSSEVTRALLRVGGGYFDGGG